MKIEESEASGVGVGGYWGGKSYLRRRKREKKSESFIASRLSMFMSRIGISVPIVGVLNCLSRV